MIPGRQIAHCPAAVITLSTGRGPPKGVNTMSIFVLVVLCFGALCWLVALAREDDPVFFMAELVTFAAFILAVVFQAMGL